MNKASGGSFGWRRDLSSCLLSGLWMSMVFKSWLGHKSSAFWSAYLRFYTTKNLTKSLNLCHIIHNSHPLVFWSKISVRMRKKKEKCSLKGSVLSMYVGDVEGIEKSVGWSLPHPFCSWPLLPCQYFASAMDAIWVWLSI